MNGELTLTLYMENGSTLRFERVTGFQVVDLGPQLPTLMKFDYVSTSRGVLAKAEFLRHKLAGWSIGE